MDYVDVVAQSLRRRRGEEIVASEDLIGDDRVVPDWWFRIVGPGGGALLADGWERYGLAAFPRTRDLLRSPAALGGVVVRSYPHGLTQPQWSFAVAFAPLQGVAAAPTVKRFDAPVPLREIPAWWDFVPSDLQNFYATVHGSVGGGALALPSDSSPRADALLSREQLATFGEAPAPRDLVLIGAHGEDQLYLDVGQFTFQGWQVSGDPTVGPRPVDLLEAADSFIVAAR